MTLVLGEEAWRTTAAAGRGAAPEDVVRFLLPWHFHVVHVLDNHVDRVPAIRVPLGGRVVVMTRNQEILVSASFGVREHRV